MMQAHTDEWGIIAANDFGFKALVLPGSSRKNEIFTQSLHAMHEVGLGTFYIFSTKPYFEIWDFDGAQSGWIREDRRGPGLVPRYCPDNNDLEIMPGLTGSYTEEPGNPVKTLPYSTLLSNKEKPGKKFAPPSFGEVEEYAKGAGLKVDGGEFCDFYESNGWMVGKNKMRSWRAAVRNWERRDKKKQAPEATLPESMKRGKG
ncbi:hypothetical protein LCGC14_1896180 [marine sediment metagenome]|uniref:Uncharacterized protein n=1 Tax=marine sediment metagenome TaxID=412755 RepID=A0A0F9FY20_9ZZZZ